ncbi:MAG: radical SAM protein [Candidatus Woesearchaeota archaeon]
MNDGYVLITRDCNNDCLFCSVPKREEYLSKDDIFTRIENLIKTGHTQITISGGEPILHKNLYEIVSFIRSKGLTARVITNGTLLDKKIINKLVMSGLNDIVFSIHSLDPSLSKTISANDEYDISKVLASLRYALSISSLGVCWNTTITGLNYKELPYIAKTISSEFKNIGVITLNFVDLSGNAANKKNNDVNITYDLAEVYLYKAMQILKKNNIIFRAERIPLCYLVGFEDYSSDYNRFSGKESLNTVFTEGRVAETPGSDYVKASCCKACYNNNICFGVHPRYAKNNGTGSLYPIFHKKK